MGTRDYDVIVVGGGGAGMSAALTSADAGARVLLVEAGDRLGGSTSLSHGVFYASGTRVQEAAGVADTPDAMFLYAMALNQYRMRPSLLRRFCDEGAAALHWLMDLGVEFKTDELYSGGTYAEMSGVPRCHAATGYGAAIAAALEASLQRYSIDVALRTRVDRLLVENGVVTGIESGGNQVTAGAVVVASGGFGANPELIERYYPSAARHGNETWYIGSKHCVGDAFTWGEQAGAALGGFDTGLLLVTPNLRRVLELPPSWILLVNADGRRFMNEAAPYGIMRGVVDAQPGGVCYGIWDAATHEKAPPDPRFDAQLKEGFRETQWQNDVLEQAVAEGRAMRGETLDELAGKLGIAPAALRHTVEVHNADAAAGVDSLFFKDGRMMHPVAAGPYYGAIFRSAMVCLTTTGLRIDRDTKVLDHADWPIEGLFAAGEAASGAFGESYIGSGSSVANAIIFGRIAGRSAAAAAQQS